MKVFAVVLLVLALIAVQAVQADDSKDISRVMLRIDYKTLPKYPKLKEFIQTKLQTYIMEFANDGEKPELLYMNSDYKTLKKVDISNFSIADIEASLKEHGIKKMADQKKEEKKPQVYEGDKPDVIEEL